MKTINIKLDHVFKNVVIINPENLSTVEIQNLVTGAILKAIEAADPIQDKWIKEGDTQVLFKTHFSIEEIRNYVAKQDSRGDIMYNLNAEGIIKANQPDSDD